VNQRRDKKIRMVVRRVQKRVSQRGLYISAELLALADIPIGGDVEITIGQRQVVVKGKRRSRCTLAELVRRIPRGYKAKEVDWGRPIGREEW
jgi:antitoxin component of MazEF toxin-antitoxin module